MATLEELIEQRKKLLEERKRLNSGTASVAPVAPIKTPTNNTPSIASSAQSILMNSRPATAVAPTVTTPAIATPTITKPATTSVAEFTDEDALRLNMANNRTEPTAVMKALSFMGNNIYNGTIKPIGQAIDKQYEKLDDYDFGRNALESAHATNVGQAQNVWDEDLLRTQRLINNRNELLSYMTPVQKLQYESLPDNKKKDYLDIIMRQLQTKKGAQRAEEIRGIDDATTKNLQKLMLSFESGGNSAKSGFKGAYNLLRGADETVAKDASEYAFEQLRPETTGAMGVVMDLANTTGRMAPAMAAGLIGAPLGLGAIGTVGMGVSSAGSGYDTAISQGYTPEQAAAYGIASGVKEAALQRIVGALPGVSGAEGAITKALGKYSDDVLGKIINNPAIASAVTRVVGNALSEGTEEAMQEVLDVGLRNVLLGENNDVDWGNVAYSGALGALTGGAFAVPSGVGAYRGVTEANRAIMEDMNRVMAKAEAEQMLNSKTPMLTGGKAVDFYGATPANEFNWNSEQVKTNNEVTKTEKTGSDYFNEGEYDFGSTTGLDDIDAETLNGFIKSVNKMNERRGTAHNTGYVLEQMYRGAEAEYNKAVEDTLEYLKNYKPQGVEVSIVPNLEDPQGLTGIRHAVSSNDAWYRDFYSTYKRAPRKVELPELAKEIVDSEIRAGGGEFVSPEFAKKYSFINNVKNIYDRVSNGGNIVGVEKDGEGYRVDYGTTYKGIPQEYKVYNGRQVLAKPLSAQVELMKGAEEATSTAPASVVSTNFNQNTVGSAAYNPEGLQAKVDEHGAIPQGEGPVARVSQIPVKIDDSNRVVSRFARTLVETGVTPEVLVSPIEQEVLNGNFTHEVIDDKKAKESALSHISNEGYAKSLEDFETKIRNNEQITKYDIALAQQLYNQAAQAAQAGDANAGKVAMRLAADMVAAHTIAGQVTQAARMLKKTTPDGNLYALERLVDKINKDKRKLKKVNGEAVKVEINEELANNLLRSKNTAEMEANVEAIKRDVANQVRVSVWDAINKWRYFSMLANPKTHIRNAFGNISTKGLYSLKDAVGVAVEGMVDKTSRAFGGEGVDKTKAILNRASEKDKALINFAKNDFETNGKSLTGDDSKYSSYNGIKEYTNPFTQNILGEKLGNFTHGATNVLGNAINKMADYNAGKLDKADTNAMRRAYTSAMAQYMKANGHTADYYNSPEGVKDATKAREYAARQAKEATFHDANWLANKISEIENKNSLAGFAVGSLIPFKKTPMNIAKRAWEFSPAGALEGGVKAVVNRSDGQALTLALDELAKGLTGSSLILIGGFLAKQGLVNGLLGSDDDKDRALKQLEGRQDYALNLGDYSMTLDTFSPGIIPILAGAELYETLIEKEGLSFGDFVDVIGSATNPIIEMSLLSSIDDLITSIRYEDNPMLAGIATVGKNYAGQFIPTLLSATARTLDPVDRSTYIDKNSNLGKTVQNVLMNAKYKTPGLHNTLEPKLDAWGRETIDDSLASRAIKNYLNPTNVKSINKTDADLEVQRLYEATGKSEVVPKKPDKYFKVNGERVDLTAGEYTQYVKDKNYASYEDISEITQMPEYKNLSDEDKAKVIEMVYEYNGIKAKEGLGKGYQSDDDKKIDALVKAGFSSAQAILLKQAVSNAGKEGSALSKSTKQSQTNFIQGLDLPANQKKALEDILVSDYQIIYNDTGRSYTSGAGSTNNEAYVLSGLGKEANKAWPKLKNSGMPLSMLEKVAGVMSDSQYPKKDQKIAQLQIQFGYSGAEATYIYEAFKNK